MFKFFNPFTRELHVADKKEQIPPNIIKTSESVEQEPFDVLDGKRPKLRRRNAFVGDVNHPMFFSINDNRLRSGTFDLTHHTNEDLIQVNKTIIHV